MLTTLLSFVFVLGFLIFVHELGHFLTAKMVGIKVERFSLGFPPRMIGKKIGDTDYCLSWLPLGGYVKMAGMIDESLDDTIKGEPWEFASKPVWQRMIVISAGSLMNVLTAIIIFSALAFTYGVPANEGAVVNQVLSGKPSEQIGLAAGDVIIAVEQKQVSSPRDLISVINANADQEISLTWIRSGDTLTALVTPELDPAQNVGLIGVGIGSIIKEAGLFTSVRQGTLQAYQFLTDIVRALKIIMTGKESFRRAVGGPIAIARMAGESAKQGFQALIIFTAVISLNLGFFNMLPFPVLDGGHMVLLLIEGVMRKPLPVKATLIIQKVGMAFLLALMIFIIINDITNLRDISF